MDISAILKWIIVSVSFAIAVSIPYIYKNKTVDTAVESVAEEVIKEETGVDIPFNKGQ